MTVRHRDLAAGRWNELSFCEQMAHVGGEVERAMAWRAKDNADYSRHAFERALELIDLTLAQAGRGPRLRELARVREALVDYFHGANDSGSTESSWRKYFLPFTYAARRHA